MSEGSRDVLARRAFLDGRPAKETAPGCVIRPVLADCAMLWLASETRVDRSLHILACSTVAPLKLPLNL
jgi:hypothetical protein